MTLLCSREIAEEILKSIQIQHDKQQETENKKEDKKVNNGSRLRKE